MAPDIELLARQDISERYWSLIEAMANSEAGDESVGEWVILAATSTDPGPPAPPAAPAVVPFDRARHCARIAGLGGVATLTRYGRAHYVAIGKAGYQTTKARHGYAYVAGLLDRKGWTARRRPDLAADLAAGAYLADLAA